MAYYDALLAIALHKDDSIDMYVRLVFLEALDRHLHAIRYLLVIEEKYLLADYLCHEETSRFVCQLILVEVWRTLRKEFLDAVKHRFHIKLVESTDRQYLSLRQHLVPHVDQFHQLFLVSQVYLVYQHDDGHIQLPHLLQEVAILVNRLHRVSDIE